MPQWLNISIGIVGGITIVGLALLLAFWPRKAKTNSWFAPPTGEGRDPTPGGSTFDGGGGGF